MDSHGEGVQFNFKRPSGYPENAPNLRTVGIVTGIMVIPAVLVRKTWGRKMHQSVSQHELDSFWKGVERFIYAITALVAFIGLRKFRENWKWHSEPRR